MPKFSAYMRGEGAQGEKGDKGEATLITQVNAIAHTSTSTGVFVNYSTDEGDGQTENKVLNFDFHLMQGEAAGFSTKQNATVEMISVGNNPSVTITTSDNSSNNSKVFNFDFKIPKGKEIQNIEQTTSSTTSSGDNIVTITYSDNTTSNFTVKNGEQGRASLIDGQVSNTNQLPTGNNYQGRAYLVGETNPKQLWVYLENQWTNQGTISGAGFGSPTGSIELLNEYIENEKSDSIVTLEKTDENEMELTALTASIEPVQDLHGYDAPWVGGAGKNLYDKDTYPLTSGRWIHKSTGSDTGTGDEYACSDFIPMTLSAGTIITLNHIVGGTNPGCAFYDSERNYISGGKGTALEVPEGTAYFRFTVPSTYADGSDVQIELGSTATEWTPYENICPITGWTGVNVQRTGKNLLPNDRLYPFTNKGVTVTKNADDSIILSGAKNESNTILVNIHNFQKNIRIFHGKYLKEQISNSVGIVVTYYDANGQWVGAQTGENIQFNIPSRAVTMNIQLRISTNNDVTGIILHPMICENQNDTYEPYKGDTLSVTFPTEAGTVYGGTVDLVTGVLTVDRAMVTIDGTLGKWFTRSGTTHPVHYVTESSLGINVAGSSWVKCLSNNFNCPGTNKGYLGTKIGTISANHQNVFFCTDITSLTDFRTWLNTNNVQLVYRLAEPITYQLTPQQLSLLKSENHLWADTGDISVTYTQKSEPYIEIIADETSPETAKVFNFHFGIPGVSASASTSTLSASSDASVNVSTSNNNIHFNFGIPQGVVGEDGVGIESIIKTGTQDLIDTYTITFTNGTTTEYNITNGKIGKDGEDGTPAGFGNITVNTTTLPSTSSAEVEIIPDDSSPDSNKNFTFNFKIPRGNTGPQGPEGIGFYQKLEFTSTNAEQSTDYNWISVSNPLDKYDTYILTINRTQNQILPISIYNIQNKNIAATFTLTSPTEQYPYGTIEYETEEKFDGILYYIGEAPTPQLEIGTVTIAEGITPSITNEKVGNNNVLSFSLPSIKGDKGDTGNTGATGPQGPKGDQGIGITNITGPVQDPNDSTKQIYTIVYGENDTTTTFTVSKGDKGDTGAKGDKGDKGDTGASGPGITSITGPIQDPTDLNKQIYTITYGANNETKTFTITNGAKGDPGVSGASEFSQLLGSPYDNESLSTILNNKLDKDGIIIPTLDYSDSITSISTNSYAGTSTYVSRGDHVHSISLTTGDENGQVKIAGVNIDVKGLQSAAYSATTAFYSSSGGNIPTMTVGGGERIDRISITNQDPGVGSELASNTILFVYTGGGGYSYCPDNDCFTISCPNDGCYSSPTYTESCPDNCYNSNCYEICYDTSNTVDSRVKYNNTPIRDIDGNIIRYATEDELFTISDDHIYSALEIPADTPFSEDSPNLYYYKVGENEYIPAFALDTVWTCTNNCYDQYCASNNCYRDPCYGECYTNQPCQVNECYDTTCPTDNCYMDYPCPGDGCDLAGCSGYVNCYTGACYADSSCPSEEFYCHSFKEMNSSTCHDYDGNSCGGFDWI